MEDQNGERGAGSLPGRKEGEEMSETKILKCDCKHDVQDKIYGKGNRLHNKGLKQYTCTVCEKKREG